MKSIFVVLAFFALTNASNLDLDFENKPEDIGEARTILSGLALNTTSLTVTLGLVAGGLLAILFVASTQQAIARRKNFEQQESFQKESLNEEYYSQPDGSQTRYKRFAPNDIASKMAQLEQAFKKYQVTEAECEMYIACEASQVNRHEENGPLAKIIFDIISTFNRAKDGHKWDDRMEGLVQAFEYGTGAQAAGQVDACEPLRNKCFELHASTKY